MGCGGYRPLNSAPTATAKANGKRTHCQFGRQAMTSQLFSLGVLRYPATGIAKPPPESSVIGAITNHDLWRKAPARRCRDDGTLLLPLLFRIVILQPLCYRNPIFRAVFEAAPSLRRSLDRPGRTRTPARWNIERKIAAPLAKLGPLRPESRFIERVTRMKPGEGPA